MQRSEQINELAAALAKAQMAMEGARKDKTNPHFKSAYADMASVWEAIRDPMAAAGLAVIQFPRTVENGIEVETMLTHSSGQFVSDVLWMPCKQMDAHGVGSAITYGRRYALMAVAGIAPVDDDGNGAATGTAGAGGEFRPAGPRKFTPAKETGFVAEARKDGIIDDTRPKGQMPGKPANGAATAIKRVEWCKASIDLLKVMQGKGEPQEWWKAEGERLAVIEDALPAEYERLIAAYDAAVDRTAARAA